MVAGGLFMLKLVCRESDRNTHSKGPWIPLFSMRAAASDVKLIAHRWAMHAVQALSQRDAELLTRVFTEIVNVPEKAIDTKVKVFGAGAPMQFHDYGFYDSRAAGFGTPLFESVVSGDTLILIALRQHDPRSVAALVRCGASLEIANASGERPIDILFDAFAAFQIHQRAQETGANSVNRTPNGLAFRPLLDRKAEYSELFTLIHQQIHQHHEAICERVFSELVEIYTASAPERIAKLETQLTDFKYREIELLAGVKRKYLEE